MLLLHQMLSRCRLESAGRWHASCLQIKWNPILPASLSSSSLCLPASGLDFLKTALHLVLTGRS